MNGKVSVIVATYNAGDKIGQLIDDLHRQTYENIEILIIDDGSTDGTQELIAGYMQQDHRIAYHQTPHQGVSAARNTGLDRVNGEFIRFCDADDRVPVDAIEKMVRAMEAEADIDIVIGSYVQNPYRFFYDGEGMKGIVLQEGFVQDFLFHIKSFYYGVTWNKLYRREIVEKHQIRFMQEMIWAEDYFFNLEYYRKCQRIFYLDSKEPVYEYVMTSGGIMSGLSTVLKQEKAEIEIIRYQKGRQFFAEYGLEEQFCRGWKFEQFITETIEQMGDAEESFGMGFRRVSKVLHDPELIVYVDEVNNSKNRDYHWVWLSMFVRCRAFFLYYCILYLKMWRRKHNLDKVHLLIWLQKIMGKDCSKG